MSRIRNAAFPFSDSISEKGKTYKKRAPLRYIVVGLGFVWRARLQFARVLRVLYGANEARHADAATGAWEEYVREKMGEFGVYLRLAEKFKKFLRVLAARDCM